MLWYKHWQMDRNISSWIFKAEQPLKQILYALCTMCLDRKKKKEKKKDKYEYVL